MNALYVYSFFFAIHLVLYFSYLTSKNRKFNINLKGSKMLQENSRQIESNQIYNAPKLANSLEKNNQIILNKNLKHLEFISDFEMYLDQKTLEKFSVEFLMEFEKIKLEAQLIALKTTNQLTGHLNRAA